MPSLFKYAVTSPRIETLIARAKELEAQIISASGVIAVRKFVAPDRSDAAAIVSGLETHIAYLETRRGTAIGQAVGTLPGQPGAKPGTGAPVPNGNARALELLREYQTLATQNERRTFAMKHREELRNGPLQGTAVLIYIECAKELHGRSRAYLACTVKQLEGRKKTISNR